MKTSAKEILWLSLGSRFNPSNRIRYENNNWINTLNLIQKEGAGINVCAFFLVHSEQSNALCKGCDFIGIYLKNRLCYAILQLP